MRAANVCTRWYASPVTYLHEIMCDMDVCVYVFDPDTHSHASRACGRVEAMLGPPTTIRHAHIS
eukprot:COSAG05_NODE_2787_length_2637_cov_3.835697_2_plen_64_part_00